MLHTITHHAAAATSDDLPADVIHKKHPEADDGDRDYGEDGEENVGVDGHLMREGTLVPMIEEADDDEEEEQKFQTAPESLELESAILKKHPP